MTSSVTVNLSGNLTSGEWDSIDSFKRRVEKLSMTEYISGNYPIKGGVKFNKQEGIVFDCDIPPDHIIVQHISAYRFFCAKKEKCFFPKVLNIIARYADNDEAKSIIKAIKMKWKNGLFNDSLQLSLNGEKMTAAMLLDIWFNGEFFHDDDEKVETLEVMKQAFPNDFFKFMLLDSITNGSKQVLMVGEGLKELTRDD